MKSKQSAGYGSHKSRSNLHMGAQSTKHSSSSDLKSPKYTTKASKHGMFFLDIENANLKKLALKSSSGTSTARHSKSPTLTHISKKNLHIETGPLTERINRDAEFMDTRERGSVERPKSSSKLRPRVQDPGSNRLRLDLNYFDDHKPINRHSSSGSMKSKMHSPKGNIEHLIANGRLHSNSSTSLMTAKNLRSSDIYSPRHEVQKYPQKGHRHSQDFQHISGSQGQFSVAHGEQHTRSLSRTKESSRLKESSLSRSKESFRGRHKSTKGVELLRMDYGSPNSLSASQNQKSFNLTKSTTRTKGTKSRPRSSKSTQKQHSVGNYNSINSTSTIASAGASKQTFSSSRSSSTRTSTTKQLSSNKPSSFPSSSSSSTNLTNGPTSSTTNSLDAYVTKFKGATLNSPRSGSGVPVSNSGSTGVAKSGTNSNGRTSVAKEEAYNGGGGGAMTDRTRQSGGGNSQRQSENGNSSGNGGISANIDPGHSDQIYNEHLYNTILALKFVRKMKHIPEEKIREKDIYLPKKNPKHKKTVIFDLDETLVHCCDALKDNPDVVIPVTFPTGEVVQAGVNLRPHLRRCLKEVHKKCEVIVFTASHQCYADAVLNFIDPNGTLIDYRLYRDNCVQTQEGVLIKDLRILKDRNLADVVIVDNAAYSFANQLDNGIPIISWYNNTDDNELAMLMTYIDDLMKYEDVRELNRVTFQLGSFVQNADEAEVDKLCRKLEKNINPQ
eukprot:CAMPEP_0114993288 /NCGR_PEP_ID=MMETSP0216-20121206/12442_1 /TAXON_ID=223996 /ORGANISM="Protocruzia adherens, Strain Boccale" /LENGTH=725 /DNA_ID=CAMNT_0002356905 /DNA_START=86 /DNA_END=2263 /DNA_ORIENTATION=+